MSRLLEATPASSARADETEKPASASHPEAASTDTLTERAQRVFLERVVPLAGVKRVVVHDEGPAIQQTVLVYVPSLVGEDARTVSRVHMQCRREFPGSRLDVQLRGLRELGLAAAPEGAQLPATATVHK